MFYKSNFRGVFILITTKNKFLYKTFEQWRFWSFMQDGITKFHQVFRWGQQPMLSFLISSPSTNVLDDSVLCEELIGIAEIMNLKN